MSLIFTYPLGFYPAFQILDNLTGDSNIARIFCVFITFAVMVSLGKQLDKFMAIIGALTCTPIAFTLPSIVYFKLCAKTPWDRAVSFALFLLSLVILIFCTAQSIVTWKT